MSYLGGRPDDPPQQLNLFRCDFNDAGAAFQLALGSIIPAQPELPEVRQLVADSAWRQDDFGHGR